MMSQTVILSKSFFGGAKPYAFTEHGVAMLASVLKTPVAVETSLRILRTFVEMRKLIGSYAGLLQRMDRFLIIDENIIYHIGASLKDMGKKWFAFSIIEKDAVAILDRISQVRFDCRVCIVDWLFWLHQPDSIYIPLRRNIFITKIWYYQKKVIGLANKQIKVYKTTLKHTTHLKTLKDTTHSNSNIMI